MVIVWMFLLFFYLCFVFMHDKDVLKARSSQDKDKNTEIMKKTHLMVGRWWSWLIIVALVFEVFKSLSPAKETTNEASKERTHQVNKTNKKAPAKKKALTKKQKAKKKQKARDLKQSQRDMADELINTPVVKDYVSKIKYRGDGYADIHVADSFTSLSDEDKTAVAKKVNNFVTSYVQDVKMLDDPFAFLTFTYNGNLVGHSKQFSHNEYKWQ